MVIPCDFTQICRLCLVKDKVNVFLFDNNDTTKSILEKINSCLPVTVSENDNLPKKICDICLEKLNATYAFQNTTLNSEKQLLTWLAESSSKSASSINDVAIEVLPDTSIVKEEAPDPDIVNELNEELHSQIEETEEPVPKRPRRSTALNRPVIEPDTEEDEDVDDVEPISKFESEDEDLEKLDIPSYLDPTTLADQPGPSGVGKESGEPTLPKMEYVDCSSDETYNIKETNNSSEECENSILTTAKESEPITISSNNLEDKALFDKIKCDICNIKFTKKWFKYHTHTQDEESKSFNCKICHQKFDTAKKLAQHNDIRGRLIFKCKVCNQRFSSKCYLEHHKKSHDEDETSSITFKCDICSKILSSKRSLERHKETNHKKVFECKICSSTYFNERDLKFHNKRMHNGDNNEKESSFICDICGKTLSSKNSYEDHLNRHKGIKPFNCSYCQKKFGTSSSLTTHVRIHTGEKPFKCEVCSSSFSQASSLTRHRRIHSGAKPFKCDHCDEAFTSNHLLTLHNQKKHLLVL